MNHADDDKLTDLFLASLNGPECRAWIRTLLILRSLPAKCRCIREYEEGQLDTSQEDAAKRLRRSA